MSYGLYISNGTDGAVITNSNSVFNEEIFSSQSGTITGGGSLSLNIEDIGDSSLTSFTIDESTPPTFASVLSVSTSSNLMTISNSGLGNVVYDLRIFRFR
jgi:lipid-binding SYLF domain-containing protein|tara:strand:+ start:1499 stop:1798 length:300 start_codon:yes stop_codon:yes gene_type:complete